MAGLCAEVLEYFGIEIMSNPSSHVEITMREKDQIPPAFTFGRVVLQSGTAKVSWAMRQPNGPGHQQLSGRKNSCRSWWSLSQFSPDRQTGPFEFHFESPAVWLWKIGDAEIRILLHLFLAHTI